jgi:hypothetical protein
MIETLTFACVGFLFLFALALSCSILFFLFTETKIFLAMLVIVFWSFIAYHLGKAVLSII